MRELVEKAAQGDLDAFGKLVERFQDAVYGTCYALLGDFHVAQDAAQEAFVQAWRDLADLRSPEKFPAWLYGIVRNRCMGFLRRKSPNQVPLSQAKLPPVGTPTPPEQLEKAEMRQAVLSAIRALSEPNRLATTLFYIDGYTVQEVAEFLAVPAGTVKRRLHDSRKQLRESMIAMVEDELKASKPGPEFKSLVEEALELQEKEQFTDAVEAHREAVEAARSRGVEDLMVAESYKDLVLAYAEAGKALQFAENLTAALPDDPEQEHAKAVCLWLSLATLSFAEGGSPQRAAEPAGRALKTAEKLKGRHDYRYLRIHSMACLRSSLAVLPDEAESDRVLRDIFDELERYEEELAENCPGCTGMDDARTEDQKQWFRAASRAYRIAASQAAKGDNRQKALQLARRAAELCPVDAEVLAAKAACALAAEGDRGTALAYFKRAAAADAPALERLRKAFREWEDFESVRDDPEFLAVLKGQP